MERWQRIDAARRYLALAIGGSLNNNDLIELIRYFKIAQKEKIDGKWRKRTRLELREALQRFVAVNAAQPGDGEDERQTEPPDEDASALGAERQAEDQQDHDNSANASELGSSRCCLACDKRR